MTEVRKACQGAPAKVLAASTCSETLVKGLPFPSQHRGGAQWAVSTGHGAATEVCLQRGLRAGRSGSHALWGLELYGASRGLLTQISSLTPETFLLFESLRSLEMLMKCSFDSLRE